MKRKKGKFKSAFKRAFSKRKFRIAAYYVLWPAGFGCAFLGGLSMLVVMVHPDGHWEGFQR